MRISDIEQQINDGIDSLKQMIATQSKTIQLHVGTIVTQEESIKKLEEMVALQKRTIAQNREVIDYRNEVEANLEDLQRRVETDRHFSNLARDHAAWSQSAFGSDAERGPMGPLRHLEKEAREAQAKTDDVTEYADCLLLVLDATHRAGFDYRALLEAAHAKLEVNKKREWPKAEADQPVEHVKAIAADSDLYWGQFEAGGLFHIFHDSKSLCGCLPYNFENGRRVFAISYADLQANNHIVLAAGKCGACLLQVVNVAKGGAK